MDRRQDLGFTWSLLVQTYRQGHGIGWSRWWRIHIRGGKAVKCRETIREVVGSRNEDMSMGNRISMGQVLRCAGAHV